MTNETRECNSNDCSWKGETDRMCGSVGPLCPECGETTEATPPAMNAASPTALSKRLREYANQSWKFSNINVAKNDLLALLDELDRCAAPVGQGSCPACQGNDADMPCAYPSEGKPGCWRDVRLGQGSAMVPSSMRVASEGSATSGEAAFEKAVDAVYPIPDSPHTSVMQRAADNRIAFRWGFEAALAAKAEQLNSAGLSDKQTLALTLAAATFDAFDIAGADDLRSIIKSAPVAERAAAPASVPEGGLVERIKRKVMGRLELRGLLTDITHNNIRILGYELMDDLEGVLSNTREVTDIRELVNRFLGWPLPKTFAPDCGISFTPLNHPNGWPIGTNLLTAVEAMAMFEYALAAPEVAQPAQPAAQGERAAPSEEISNEAVAGYQAWMRETSKFPHNDDRRHPYDAFVAGAAWGAKRAPGSEASE